MTNGLLTTLTMTTSITEKILLLVTSLSAYPHSAQAQNHSDATSLFDDKLKNYNTEVRPRLDQTQTTEVDVTFNLMAIIEADDVTQRFVASGFLTLEWMDEVVAWDPASYNNIENLNPKAGQLWRPRLVLFNTLGARDLFENDASPIKVKHTGEVTWYPGSLFPVSCKFDLRKFPFDKQVCHIQMVSMSSGPSEVTFTPSYTLGTYTESDIWSIDQIEVTNGSMFDLSMFTISFTLKRRYEFFMVNVMLPVATLSFLSILVFLVPADSGEKISYGITVLLSLSVFMAIVSDMLPRMSGKVPFVTIYLGVLVILSVCNLVMAIIVVWLYYWEEYEDESETSEANSGNIMKLQWKIKSPGPVRNSPFPSPMMQVPVLEPGDVDAVGRENETLEEPSENLNVMKYRVIGSYINSLSFAVSLTIWKVVTIGYIVLVSLDLD